MNKLWSDSSLNMLHKCPRKYRLHAEFKRPFTPRPSTEIGKSFHKVAELAVTQPLEDVLGQWRRWSEAVVQDYSHLPEEEQMKVAESHDKGLALWRGYLDGIETLEPRIVKVLAAEHRFAMPIPDLDITIRGVIDQISLLDIPDRESRKSNYLLAIGDYKTTSMEIEPYLASLLKSRQCALYLMWSRTNDFRETFPDIAEEFGLPEAVFLDVIQTPKVRQKKTELWPEYLARYQQDVTLEEEPKLRRHVFFPTERTTLNIEQSLLSDVQTYKQYYESGYWPKFTHSCLDVSGEMCEYSSECDSMDLFQIAGAQCKSN